MLQKVWAARQTSKKQCRVAATRPAQSEGLEGSTSITLEWLIAVPGRRAKPCPTCGGLANVGDQIKLVLASRAKF